MPNLREDKNDFFDEDFPPVHEGEDAPLVAREGELTPARWFCAACGQPNETLVDLGAGFAQEYVEDCGVCCRPNLIALRIEEDTLIITLKNELEYD